MGVGNKDEVSGFILCLWRPATWMATGDLVCPARIRGGRYWIY
jgi:hypothetical protein